VELCVWNADEVIWTLTVSGYFELATFVVTTCKFLVLAIHIQVAFVLMFHHELAINVKVKCLKTTIVSQISLENLNSVLYRTFQILSSITNISYPKT